MKKHGEGNQISGRADCMKTITFDETKWQLVPIEPTKDMLYAAYDATVSNAVVTTHWLRDTMYRAMLSVAPQPPVADDVVGDAERYRQLVAKAMIRGAHCIQLFEEFKVVDGPEDESAWSIKKRSMDARLDAAMAAQGRED